MKKTLSVLLMVILSLISLSSFVFAKNDAVIVLDSNTINISNVVSEQSCEVDGYREPRKMFTATAPVKVTFVDDTARQEISTSEDWIVKEDGTLYMSYDVPARVVEPDFAQYKIWNENGEKITVDNLPEDYDEEYLYAAGSYTTLTEPGVYYVFTSGPATAGDVCIIYVVEQTLENTPGNSPNNDLQKASATPSSAKIKVDGKDVTFQGYTINDNNFFKLRDLAMVLNGTEKQIKVDWDQQNNAIALTTGLSYTAVGGELTISSNVTSQEAILTTSKIYLNGNEVSFTAYNIGGNNYFKLRDIGKALDFGVNWNGTTSTIEIVTSTGYSE